VVRVVVAVGHVPDRLVGSGSYLGHHRLRMPWKQLAVEHDDALRCDREDGVDVDRVVGRRVHVDITPEVHGLAAVVDAAVLRPPGHHRLRHRRRREELAIRVHVLGHVGLLLLVPARSGRPRDHREERALRTHEGEPTVGVPATPK
jgi:hypothetical protein